MRIPSFPLRQAGVVLGLLAASGVHAAPAAPANNCAGLPTPQQLETALKAVVGTNGGFNLAMWATAVNRYGVVCAVATTGAETDSAWLNSRVISAQKAYTANGFSTPTLALSTANLFTAVQPGNSLFGLQHSNPVDPRVSFRGDSTKYGQVDDPMVGLKPGGINVFGGGLALYSASAKLGAIGVSGDTSCADHNIAWKLRNRLATGGYSGVSVANRVPAGVRAAGNTTNNATAPASGDDGIFYGNTGFAHATCGGTEPTIALPPVTN